MCLDHRRKTVLSKMKLAVGCWAQWWSGFMLSLYPSPFCYLRPVCVSFHGCHVAGWRCLCDGPFLTCRLSTHNTACRRRQQAKCQRAHCWPTNQIFPFSTQQEQHGPQQQHTECHCLHDKYVLLPCERWATPEGRWLQRGAATAGGLGNDMFDARHTAVILFQFLTSFCSHALWRGNVFTTASLKYEMGGACRAGGVERFKSLEADRNNRIFREMFSYKD